MATCSSLCSISISITGGSGPFAGSSSSSLCHPTAGRVLSVDRKEISQLCCLVHLIHEYTNIRDFKWVQICVVTTPHHYDHHLIYVLPNTMDSEPCFPPRFKLLIDEKKKSGRANRAPPPRTPNSCIQAKEKRASGARNEPPRGRVWRKGTVNPQTSSSKPLHMKKKKSHRRARRAHPKYHTNLKLALGDGLSFFWPT